MDLDFFEILSAFIVVFAVLDILGSMPIVIAIREKGGAIDALKATTTAFVIMIAFMFLGEALLSLFGIDINSFAVAGAFVLFIIGLEMVLGLEIMKQDAPSGASIVPIAFPLLAGPGTFTTLISLRAEYATANIIIAVIINMLIVYIILHWTDAIAKRIGAGGVYVLKKFFGIILLAISVKLFTSNITVLIEQFVK